MNAIQEVEARREAVLEEMRGMRAMKRGTINEQFLKVPHKGKAKPVRRGPYYVFSRSQGGKTVSQRLAPGPQLEQARKDVAEHKRFVELCGEFERLTERLGELEHHQRDLQSKKKRRKSPSSKTRK